MTTTLPARDAAVRRPARRGAVRALLVACTVALTAAGALPATAATTASHVTAAAAVAAASGDTLNAGSDLAEGQTLTSSNGQYTAVMQADRNFVVYGPSGPIWASGTAYGPGKPPVPSHLAMQTDGNLVIYVDDSVAWPLWATMTSGPNSKLVMQSDGNLVIYSGSRPLWSTKTGKIRYDVLPSGATLKSGQALISSDGRYTAIMQADGNFVVYGPGNTVLYVTGTSGALGAYLVMRTNGMASLYNKQGSILGTLGGNIPGSYMVMQSDGNLVIYTKSGQAAWWSR